MTRYYYTDALAAAWMAEKFQMKFQDDFTAGFQFWEEGRVGSAYGTMGKRIFLDPDSLHLLEPIEDDIIDMQPDGFLERVLTSKQFKKLEKEMPSITSHFTTKENICGDESFIDTDWKIIQRNNLPFMWPEVEND